MVVVSVPRPWRYKVNSERSKVIADSLTHNFKIHGVYSFWHTPCPLLVKVQVQRYTKNPTHLGVFPLPRVLHSIDAFQPSLTLNLTLHKVPREPVAICVQDTTLGEEGEGGGEGVSWKRVK